ncbi:hypothetical protein G6O69_14765 [Pseudenhygromyxa sp. WMMC2535]|uniref:hypothetical protein n=1 Tax=Pseudenhygromyxa sp. WMMC2535 TaxID=2712867 RepID=UPI00159549DB|nr:hypothetical protein [Pseudenhygromyxa sp. WMMC2535]NVB39103.1 hypothetical protein [Pseudenhygromyxa sp. WMMC2535]
MPYPPRPRVLAALTLSTGLLALTACKSSEAELEQKAKEALEEPLEDPWVAALGSEGDDAFAEAEIDPAAEAGELAAAEAGEAEAGEAAAAEAGEAEAGGEVAAAEAGEAAEGDAAAAEPAAPSVAATADAQPRSATAEKTGDADEPSGATEAVAAAPAEPTPSAEEPAAVASAAPAATKPAAEPEPAKPAPITLADFDGSYKYVGGSKQREGLEKAIEEAVLQLNAAIRGIGRRRLTKTNPIPTGLDISVNGTKLKTAFSSGFDPECNVGSSAVTWSNGKDSYKVKVVQKGSKLVQVIVGEDGVKTTVYVLSADRQRLTVHHKISSDRLQTPMTYRLSYARK